MADEISWKMSNLLTADKFALGTTGQVASASIENTGKATIFISLFAVEFSWQRVTGKWWPSKCNIQLIPGEKSALPTITFAIPVNAPIGPGDYRYAVKLHHWNSEARKWLGPKIMWGRETFPLTVVPHPDRGFTVFVSHSNDNSDAKVLTSLYTLLQNNGIKCFVAEKTPKYGECLWTKILRGIRASDRTIILWTKAGANSADIREEIGITVGTRRLFIPVVEKRVEPKGSLIGTEFIEFTKRNADRVFVELTRNLIRFAEEKAKRTKSIKPAERVS